MSDLIKELTYIEDDKYYGIEIQEVIKFKKKGSLEGDQDKSSLGLNVFVEKINNNPDALLSMPRLDSEKDSQVIEWLNSMGIEDTSESITTEQIQQYFTLSPEVLDELSTKDTISIKDLLESVRYEYAIKIFTSRKVNEATKKLNATVSPNLIPHDKITAVVLYNHYQDPYLPKLREVSGSYIGNLDGTHIIAMEMEVDSKNIYLDPFNTFNEEIEHDISWMLGHEITHAWQNEQVGSDHLSVQSVEKLKKDFDISQMSLPRVVSNIILNSMQNHSWQVNLSDALKEGSAVFIETKIADADILANSTSIQLQKKLIEARKNLYLSHLEVNGINPYREGFYEIIRKLRSNLRDMSKIIELFSLIDYEKCASILLEDEDNDVNKEGFRYVEDIRLIPLINSKNSLNNVGEFIDKYNE